MTSLASLSDRYGVQNLREYGIVRGFFRSLLRIKLADASGRIASVKSVGIGIIVDNGPYPDHTPMGVVQNLPFLGNTQTRGSGRAL